MLPESVRTRVQVRHDADGNETGRIDVPATYAWKLTQLRTGDVAWVSEDDVRRDQVTRRLFHGRPEGEPATHTVEKIGKDGETRYGPRDI